MVLKLIDYRRNPLDYSQYAKPAKKIKEEFLFERLTFKGAIYYEKVKFV